MGPVEEAFFSDAYLIGIATRLSATTLCILLQHNFGFRFIRQPELDKTIDIPNKGSFFFPVYEYFRPYGEQRFNLYQLKRQEEHLLPEIGKLDFLWMIAGNLALSTATELTDVLRTFPEIQLAQILDVNKIKQKNRLII